MSVDIDNVKKIAKLSKISLSENEIKKFLTDLNQIIGWVDQLTEVDTEKVAPTFSSFGVEEGIKKRSDIMKKIILLMLLGFIYGNQIKPEMIPYR